MNQYEVMYILDTTIDDAKRNELIARYSALVEQNGGIIDRVDEWGKRRLAYTINYKSDGYYVLMYIQGPSDLPRELERNLQISEFVLRYLVIRFEGVIPPKREQLKPYAAPAGHAAPQASVAEVEAPTSEVEAPTSEAEAPEADAEAPVTEAPVAEAEAPQAEETVEVEA